MRCKDWLSAVLGSAFLVVPGAWSQAGAPTPATTVRLSAVLNGEAASALRPGDITLLDNGTPAQLLSWRPLNPGTNPVHVFLVIDDVNARLTTVAYERSEIKKFLTADEGRLRVPFSIAIMTDTQLQMQQGSSQNGIVENDILQKQKIGLHELTPGAQWGHLDRTNIGLRSLEQLVQYGATIPGRKLILFVSPGWPLLSGPRIDLTDKEQQQIYKSIAQLQDSMLRANVTLHMLNPFGPGESLLRADYYAAFLQGVRKPEQAQIADLSLQVLAVHSGGEVQQGSSDITGMIRHALADLDHSYSVEFAPAVADRADEYHALALKVNRGGLTARIPDAYYAEPPGASSGGR